MAQLFVLRPEKWSQTWPNVVQRLGGEFFGGWADGKKGFPLVKHHRYQWLMMVNDGYIGDINGFHGFPLVNIHSLLLEIAQSK